MVKLFSFLVSEWLGLFDISHFGNVQNQHLGELNIWSLGNKNINKNSMKSFLFPLPMGISVVT